MSVVSKVYREPKEALKAIESLSSHNFHARDIGVMVRDNAVGEMIHLKHNKYPTAKITVPGAGALLLMGSLASFKKPENGIEPELAKCLAVNEDKLKYYLNDIVFGSVVVSVIADEASAAKAENILKEAESVVRFQVNPKTAGFNKASRMVATNPIDAPMSGDFRKY